MTYIFGSFFGSFVMFIFAFLCLALAVQGYPDCVEDGARMYKHCLNKWRMYREFGEQPSAFLTRETLVDEVCSSVGHDKSLKAIGRCVHATVSPICEHVLVVWKATKQMMIFLCKHQKGYYLHTRCRTNEDFARKFDHCLQDHVSRVQDQYLDECWSYSQMEICFSQALKQHCSSTARKYFELVFDAHFSPFKAYARCPDDDNTFRGFLRNKEGPAYDMPSTHHKAGIHNTEPELTSGPVQHVDRTTRKLTGKQTARAPHEERVVIVPIWDQQNPGHPNVDPLRSGAPVRHVSRITTVLAGILTVIMFTTT